MLKWLRERSMRHEMRANQFALESKRAELEKNAIESLWSVTGTLVDPATEFGSDWIVIGDEKKLSSSKINNINQLKNARNKCRGLWVENGFAQNADLNLKNFIVGQGFKYSITDESLPVTPERAAKKESENIIARMYDVWWEFVERARWESRETEIVTRAHRDGEVFLRFFRVGGGQLAVRYVNPEEIKPPMKSRDVASAPWGVYKDTADTERIIGYFVKEELVDAAEIEHLKLNVDDDVDRGIPTFYSVGDALTMVQKQIRAIDRTVAIQSSIALIRKHTAGKSDVDALRTDLADREIKDAATGDTIYQKKYLGGDIIDAPKSVDYEFPSAGIHVDRFVAAVQFTLRAIAARFVFPEFMFTADASNNNKASAMVAQGPAARNFETQQKLFGNFARAVFNRVIAEAVAVGNLPDRAAEMTITVIGPQVATRDQLERTKSNEIMNAKGVLSKQTWAAQEGLDYETEQANIEAHDDVYGGTLALPLPAGEGGDEGDVGEARGLGMGVGEPAQQDGGAEYCECPECGHTQKHERGTPCTKIKCPECGAMMVGKSK